MAREIKSVLKVFPSAYFNITKPNSVRHARHTSEHMNLPIQFDLITVKNVSLNVSSYDLGVIKRCTYLIVICVYECKNTGMVALQ